MPLTLAKLQKFVKVRNKAEFNSNLQFQSDANSCGFSVKDLGSVKKFSWGYIWDLPALEPLQLWETNGRLKVYDPREPTNITEIEL